MRLSRREFLATTGRLGLGAAVLREAAHRLGGGGTPLAEAQAAPWTIHLEANAMTWELAPGAKVLAMGYNGRVPGPEIRVREGKPLRVVVRNALPEPTTVHWHGVEVPNAMDGVGGLTQTAIAPGEAFVYEFEARPAGTRFFHTHVQEHRQMDMGLAGTLIIEPAGGDPMTADRELTLMLDDWRVGRRKPVPPTHDGIGAFRRHRGGGTPLVLEADPAATYDTMTINGKAYPATEPLRLDKGERVRLRIINASAEHTHILHLGGHRLHVTHVDGNPLQEPVEVDAIPIAPAERYDVVVVGDRPGAWFLSCVQPEHAEAGERMLVSYAGHEGRTPAGDAPDVTRLELWEYGRGRGRPLLAAPTGATHEFEMLLGGGMDASNTWPINNKLYPDTDPVVLKLGDRARIKFVNLSPDSHPMHLHGQSFQVLRTSTARFRQPLVKDVVDVEPYMGWVLVEFTAINPGNWLLHCHKPRHMAGGMTTLVKIT